jgi:hypothetical protein
MNQLIYLLLILKHRHLGRIADVLQSRQPYLTTINEFWNLRTIVAAHSAGQILLIICAWIVLFVLLAESAQVLAGGSAIG